MFALRKNMLFGISVLIFEVSSCTKFQIFGPSGFVPLPVTYMLIPG